MARCRRCGSVKAVGRVKTMSPNYGSEEKPGFAQEFYVCMRCIIELESWVKGKDFKRSGQGTLS